MGWKLPSSMLYCVLLCSLLLALPHLGWAALSLSGSAASKDKAGVSDQGAVLFHRGDDALSWSNDDLSRLRDLHTRNFKADSKADALASGNLAKYLGLSPLEALHMPVPLNIILIGFMGDGNLQVRVKVGPHQVTKVKAIAT